SGWRHTTDSAKCRVPGAKGVPGAQCQGPSTLDLRPSTMKLLPLAFALLPTIAAAQALPTRTIGKPDAEFTEPFTRVSGVRELRDGRLIVADQRDQTLQRIDLKTGDATPVSRKGSGPNEYAMPVDAFALPGDSTLVF